MSLGREAVIATAAAALLLPGAAFAQQQQPAPPAASEQQASPPNATSAAQPPATTAMPPAAGTASQDQGTATPQPSAKTPPTPLPKKAPNTAVTGVKPGAEKDKTTLFDPKSGQVPGQPLPSDPSSIRTLQDALNAAFARNPNILFAQERGVKTNATVNSILALERPQVSASGSAGRLANPSSSLTVPTSVSPSQITNPFGVGLSVTPPGSSPIQLSTTTGTSGGAGSGTSTTSSTTTVTGASASTSTSTASSASSVTSGTSGLVGRDEVLPAAATRATNSVSLTSPLNQANARVSISQFIDITGIVKTAVQVGDLEKALSRLELARTRQQTVLDVTNGYYSVLKALAFVQVNEAAVADSEELLRVTQAQLKAGVASQFDVLRAQTQLDNNRQALISSRNQVAISKNALANQIGIDPSTVVDPQPVSVPPLPALDEETLIQQAFQQRPEYLEADVNLLVAQKNIRLARRNLDPSLSVGVSGAYNATASAFTKDKATASIGATLSVPLYDGGATRAQVDAARSDERGARIQKDQFTRGIKAEVQQAVIAVRDANDRSTAIASTVAEAREALRLANVRFRAGVGTQLDVNDAESALVQAQTNQVNALYDYLGALARLSRAVGTPV